MSEFTNVPTDIIGADILKNLSHLFRCSSFSIGVFEKSRITWCLALPSLNKNTPPTPEI